MYLLIIILIHEWGKVPALTLPLIHCATQSFVSTGQTRMFFNLKCILELLRYWSFFMIVDNVPSIHTVILEKCSHQPGHLKEIRHGTKCVYSLVAQTVTRQSPLLGKKIVTGSSKI